MKKNNLLSEINRISELMGSRTLLTEQPIPKLIEIITRFADDAAKKGWKIGSVVQSELDALSRVVDDEDALKLIAQIANKSPEFASEIIPVIMKTLNQGVKDEILRITNLAKAELDAGKSIDDVNKIIDTEAKSIRSEFEGVKEIIKKQIKDEVKVYTPKPSPKPSPVEDLNLRQKFEKVFEEWENILPGKLTTKDKLLMTDDLWFRGLRARTNQLFNSAFKTEEQSIRRIAELSQQAFKEMDNAEVRKTLFKTIDIELENLRKNENFTKQKAFEILGAELQKKVKNYAKANELITALEKNQSLHGYQSYWRHLLDETYVGRIFSMPKYKEGVNAGKINWGASIGNLVHRTMMTLTTGNPRKYNEVLEEFVFAYGKSALKGFGIYLLWLHGVKRIVFPVIFGLVDTAYYGWKNETGKDDFDGFWDTYGFFIKERIKDTFLIYDKSFEQNVKMDKYELSVWKTILSTINPFSWFWDDIQNFADWHTEGGSRRAWERFLDKSKEAVAENDKIKKLEEKFDSTVAKAEKAKEDLEDFSTNIKDKQIKGLLADWMNKNGFEDIDESEHKFMKNMGDNKWSWQSGEENEDGTFKFYYFQFDPINMTFKEIVK